MFQKLLRPVSLILAGASVVLLALMSLTTSGLSSDRQVIAVIIVIGIGLIAGILFAGSDK